MTYNFIDPFKGDSIKRSFKGNGELFCSLISYSFNMESSKIMIWE